MSLWIGKKHNFYVCATREINVKSSYFAKRVCSYNYKAASCNAKALTDAKNTRFASSFSPRCGAETHVASVKLDIIMIYARNARARYTRVSRIYQVSEMQMLALCSPYIYVYVRLQSRNLVSLIMLECIVPRCTCNVGVAFQRIAYTNSLYICTQSIYVTKLEKRESTQSYLAAYLLRYDALSSTSASAVFMYVYTRLERAKYCFRFVDAAASCRYRFFFSLVSSSDFDVYVLYFSFTATHCARRVMFFAWKRSWGTRESNMIFDTRVRYRRRERVVFVCVR